MFTNSESVDKLLEEMHHDPSVNDSHEDSQLSPTKPLKVHAAPEKEFNSSSDTYTSDKDEHDSLMRNFELPENFDKSVQTKIMIEENEFTFVSPSTPKKAEPDNVPYTNNSPNKSIMKKVTTPSPKKNVAFTSDPQVHHYTFTNLSSNTSDLTEDASTAAEPHPLPHRWNDLDKLVSSLELGTPPVPPPHTTQSDHLLYISAPHNDTLDASVLQDIKNRRLSNMSLNDKLDAYLSNPQNEDLDLHLTDLNQAVKYQTDSNIHYLSLDLQQTHDDMENPLNSLAKSNEVRLKSSGSSQSSLQSLVASNRVLESRDEEATNRGIELNDGIKGFPDYMVSDIVPSTTEHDASAPRRVTKFDLSSDEDVYHDSFDNSYNNTEKSIMNLLNSASSLQVNDPHTVKEETSQTVKEEQKNQSDNEHIPTEPALKGENPFLSDDKVDGDSFIKTEAVSHDFFNLDHSFMRADPDTKVAPSASLTFPLKEELPEPSVSDPDDSSQLETSNSGIKSENVMFLKDEPIEPFTVFDELLKSESDVSNGTFVKSEQRDLKSEPRDLVKSEQIESEQFKPEADHIVKSEPEKLKSEPEGLEASPVLKAEPSAEPSVVKSEVQLMLDDSFFKSEHKLDEFKIDEKGLFKLEDQLDSGVPQRLSSVHSFTLKSEDLFKAETSNYSNDGDNEDNDETDRELPTVHHIQPPKLEDVDDQASLASSEFKDASDIEPKSLAPPRVDEAIDATSPPSPVKRALLEKQKQKEAEEEDDALANSSNVAPPDDIALPQIETNNFSSFDDLTRQLEVNTSKDTFEESLSAEHDADKKPTDFLSIWHSQLKQRRYSSLTHNTGLVLSVNLAPSTQPAVRIPSSLQAKKFKEVNVMSRRVVSPDFEDLHVTGFLPEVSEDSGFANHFKSLVKGNETTIINNGKRNVTPLNTKTILLNIDNDPTIVAPPAPQAIQKRTPSNDFASRYREKVLADKKSKFKVPSFEIKRLDLVLSPRNKYNDIFNDTLKEKPTIKAPGMKTLPSMDRDDVQKILEAKRMISQEEYSRMKLVGSAKKNSIVDEPSDKFDKLQQHASFYETSMDSGVKGDLVSPHIASELAKQPTVLLGKDQHFNETSIYLDESQAFVYDYAALNNSDTSGLVLYGRRESVPNLVEAYGGPDVSPKNSIFKTPPASVNDKEDEVDMKYRIINKSPKKSAAKGTPIKIGSPIKLVRQGSSVTGVTLLPKKKHPSFSEELVNNKVRDQPAAEGTHVPSTVSVPSTHPSTTSSATLLNPHQHQYRNVLEQSAQVEPSAQGDETPTLQERGKLFLRVIGLKNIALPQVGGQNASLAIYLDNGVHCIKTPDYALDSNSVTIGKEFELTVGESLEFILTIKANYEKPRGKLVEVRERKVVKSKSRISRMFGSKNIVTTTKFVPKDAEDPWAHKMAPDGSFARCYVDLDQYESQVTGEPRTFNINCFNEWETTINSTPDHPVRLKPYRVGELEVKMLYVPRVSPHEVLPTSIKTACDSIEDIRHEATFTHEGYLHQEGGDCEIWKRRYFKLSGTSLIAHSEFSHKTRAKINLAKVAEVIYVDKENFERKRTNFRVFSDILLVEHAFKIKFANGEVIDFGAPNKQEKDEWIAILENIVYRNKFRRQPWVKLMLEKTA